MDAGNIVIKVAVDTGALKSGLADADSSMRRWRDQTNENTKEMLKWGAAITATTGPLIAAATAAYASAEKYGTMAQSITDLSYTTGLSTKKIQELQYAATLAGTQFSVITSTIDNFTIAIANSRDTTSEVAKAFATLGVTTTGRTTDQILDDTVVALTNMKNETDRNAIAMTLYGKAWKEMIPYMQTYVEKAQEIKDNPYLTENELAQLAESKELLDALGSKATITGGKIVALGEQIFTLANNLSNMNYAALGGVNGLTALFDVIAKKQSTSAAVSSIKDPFKSTVSANYIDEYAGLSGIELEIKKTTEEILKDEADIAAAREAHDKDAFNRATYAHAADVAHLADLKSQLADINATTSKTTASISNIWASTAVIGSKGSEMAAFMLDEMNNGADYQSALNAWSGSGTHTYARNDYGTLAGASGDTIKSGSAAETETVKTETEKQQTLFTNLNTGITSGYVTLETDTKTHWTAISDIARIAMQKLMDDWYTTSNYISSTIAYKNIITATNGVADGSPLLFSGKSPSVLAALDLSGVKTLGGGTGTASGSQSGSGTTPAPTVNVNVNTTLGLNNNVSATVSGALASNVTLNGGTAGL